ncbi:BOS complex subunit NCLN-like [Anomaloglossus baeobatrachus]|uniref:BOS complex subunit NCLN-like n=1 Tax=Anomaloglossus baeobatrachus TaxID=238106 RepID=UPI003F500DA2
MSDRSAQHGAPISRRMGVVVLLILLPGIAALEFTVYRMQQYSLEGRSHGCRLSQVSAESRTLDAELLTRRCVIMKITDFSMETWSRILSQSAAAILILVPVDLPAELTSPERLFMEGEMAILRNETLLPVYFTLEDPELLEMYEESRAASLSLTSSSALEVMIGMVMGSGFQMTTSEIQSKPMKDPVMVTLEGQLPGHREAATTPTIAVVAHYDAFGAAPFLAYGADSNGSGVSVLLEMIRVFHALYSSPWSRGRYNVLFSLTGGGKLNYQGSKRWIEEHLDHSEFSILHENVALVLCLDTLGNGDSLHLHVSRPPAEGTAQWEIMKELQSVVLMPPFLGVNVSVVHKKIYLGETMLSWEHEQFSVQRLPALTVSHLDNHKSGVKTSILDTRSRVDVKKLRRNTEILCEVLARLLYKDTIRRIPRSVRVFEGDLGVREERLAALLDWLTSQPRAAQLITKEHPILSTLEHLLRRHLKHVRRHVFKPDDRNPEFVFYDQMRQTMTSHRVKPAVFDLFMALVIAVYLGLIHQAVQNFTLVYCKFIHLITKEKKK